MFDVSQKGRGCIVLDELIYFDRNITPKPGDPVLIIDGDGFPAVRVAANHPSGTVLEGRVWIELPPTSSYRHWAHHPCLGVVTTQSGRPRRAVRD